MCLKKQRRVHKLWTMIHSCNKCFNGRASIRWQLQDPARFSGKESDSYTHTINSILRKCSNIYCDRATIINIHIHTPHITILVSSTDFRIRWNTLSSDDVFNTAQLYWFDCYLIVVSSSSHPLRRCHDTIALLFIRQTCQYNNFSCLKTCRDWIQIIYSLHCTISIVQE